MEELTCGPASTSPSVVYLMGKKYHESKMSIGRTLYANELAKLTEVTVTGNGWDNYRMQKPVEENFAIAGLNPKAIWCYKGNEHSGVPKSGRIKFITFNEAHDPSKTMEEIEAVAPTFVVFHHENDLARWKGRLGKAKLVHILHGAEASLAANPVPYKQRENDYILAGVVSDVYPLRKTFAALIRSGDLDPLRGSIRRHPGYRLPSRKAVLEQYADYCHTLRNTRIALVCSSKYRYPLAKYIEAFMAGCLVIGDVPDGDLFASIFGDCYVKVDPGATKDELDEVIRYFTADQDEASAIAQLGQEQALANCTSARYAELILKEIQNYC